MNGVWFNRRHANLKDMLSSDSWKAVNGKGEGLFCVILIVKKYEFYHFSVGLTAGYVFGKFQSLTFQRYRLLLFLFLSHLHSLLLYRVQILQLLPG